MQANVLLEDGQKLDKKTISKALGEQNLKLAGFEEQTVPLPKSTWELTVTGAT